MTWADNAPFSKDKGSFLEGGIRVPFVASWPTRWPEGETFEPMVSSLDIAATALALAGSAVDPDRPLDGVNLDPFVRGSETGSPRKALFWALFWRQSAWDPNRTTLAVRADRTKLVKDDPEGKMQLFNLAEVPGETTNLFDSKTEATTRLVELWNAWNRENINNIYPEAGYYESIRHEFFLEAAEEYRVKGMETPIFQIGKAP